MNATPLLCHSAVPKFKLDNAVSLLQTTLLYLLKNENDKERSNKSHHWKDLSVPILSARAVHRCCHSFRPSPYPKKEEWTLVKTISVSFRPTQLSLISDLSGYFMHELTLRSNKNTDIVSQHVSWNQTDPHIDWLSLPSEKGMLNCFGQI